MTEKETVFKELNTALKQICSDVLQKTTAKHILSKLHITPFHFRLANVITVNIEALIFLVY
jgi:hypothetical protein